MLQVDAAFCIENGVNISALLAARLDTDLNEQNT